MAKKAKIVPVSNVWYLVPIFFGLLGSLIVWFALKNTNREKAKEIAIIGFVINIAIAFVLFPLMLFFAIVSMA